jgi:spore germination cell wall hydrolase CwlJ-like protein
MMNLIKALVFTLSILFTTTMTVGATILPTLAELSKTNESSKSDLYWMAMNIYYEAGAEPLIGKIAVGVVTMNRLHDKRFPKNIRDVVTETNQFSWYTSKGANTPPANNQRWKESYEVAKMLLTKAIGSDIIKLLEGATHFHAIDIKPAWTSRVTKVAQIEGHIFYRMK